MSEKRNNKSKHNCPKKKSIKYGIIHQQSENINIKEFFNSYFEEKSPNIIKNNEKSYVFSPNDNINNSIVFDFAVLVDSDMNKIYDIYKYFNFFLIFIDIHNIKSFTCLEQYIDQLIDCSEDITKKCYIFGVYCDEKRINNKDKRIINILNSKGIDYEYSEININIREEFSKGIQYIIEDSKEIMEEIEFQGKNEMDYGKSCQII